MSRLQSIRDFGQRVWLDNLSVDLLESGELSRLIIEDGIAGVTSNPAIFYNAISSDLRYQERLSALTDKTLNAEQRYEAIILPDIQKACDLFLPCYEQSQQNDGYVSLELSPYLANDFNATLLGARRLWQKVARKNLMIKIPATKAGIEALQVLSKEGLNINMTLLFSLKQVKAVWSAYIKGLLERKAAGLDVTKIKAVASFFMSRIDNKLDSALPKHLRGKVAISLAKAAYARYQEVFSGKDFAALRCLGAFSQNLLWASTGTKNPEYSDVLYVENLIGSETINTIPDATMALFREHGVASSSLESSSDAAVNLLLEVKQLGVDLDALGEQLQQDGLALFADAFDKLLVLSRPN